MIIWCLGSHDRLRLVDIRLFGLSLMPLKVGFRRDWDIACMSWHTLYPSSRAAHGQPGRFTQVHVHNRCGHLHHPLKGSLGASLENRTTRYLSRRVTTLTTKIGCSYDSLYPGGMSTKKRERLDTLARGLRFGFSLKSAHGQCRTRYVQSLPRSHGAVRRYFLAFPGMPSVSPPGFLQVLG